MRAGYVLEERKPGVGWELASRKQGWVSDQKMLSSDLFLCLVQTADKGRIGACMHKNNGGGTGVAK